MFHFFNMLLLCILSFTSHSQGQTKLSTPKNHPCYQGIKISVVNYGYSKEAEAYLWGVRFTSSYKLPVSFKYRLSVGEKNTSTEKGDSVRKLQNGISFIVGGDKLTAKLYHNPSEEWTVYIWDVCFDGMKCGGTNQCYAECDKIAEKENQLCGLSGEYSPAPGSNNPYPIAGKQAAPAGATKEESETKAISKGPSTTWVRDDSVMKMIIQLTVDGLSATREGSTGSNLFKKIDEGSYRLESGKDFYIIKFDGEKKFSYWNTGVLENMFTLEETEKQIIKGATTIRSGIWASGSDSINIELKDEGLNYKIIFNNVDTGTQFYKKISPAEYKWFDSDGVHSCILKLNEDGKLNQKCNGDNLGSYTFVSGPEITTGNVGGFSIPQFSE